MIPFLRVVETETYFMDLSRAIKTAILEKEEPVKLETL